MPVLSFRCFYQKGKGGGGTGPPLEFSFSPSQLSLEKLLSLSLLARKAELPFSSLANWGGGGQRGGKEGRENGGGGGGRNLARVSSAGPNGQIFHTFSFHMPPLPIPTIATIFDRIAPPLSLAFSLSIPDSFLPCPFLPLSPPFHFRPFPLFLIPFNSHSFAHPSMAQLIWVPHSKYNPRLKRGQEGVLEYLTSIVRIHSQLNLPPCPCGLWYTRIVLTKNIMAYNILNTCKYYKSERILTLKINRICIKRVYNLH